MQLRGIFIKSERMSVREARLLITGVERGNNSLPRDAQNTFLPKNNRQISLFSAQNLARGLTAAIQGPEVPAGGVPP